EEMAPAATNSGSWPRSQRTARRLTVPGTERIQSERFPDVNLAFPSPDCDQDNSADQTDSTDDRRKVYPLIFGMLDLQRTKLSVFFFRRPMQASPGKANNADDDQNNSNNCGRFHAPDTTR